jgi:hypothetical protein
MRTKKVLIFGCGSVGAHHANAAITLGYEVFLTDINAKQFIFFKDKLYPKRYKKWDYKRELEIEDVNLWETVAENACGVYVSYDPYAEFYLIIDFKDKTKFKTYYGPKAQQKVIKKMKELKIDIPFRKIWVDPEDMWLY